MTRSPAALSRRTALLSRSLRQRGVLPSWLLTAALSFACVWLTGASPLLGVSLAVLPDPLLLAEADLVVNGRVIEVAASSDSTFTRITLAVDQVLRGESERAVVTVVRPGVQEDLLSAGQESQLVVPGLPTFVRGDEVLVFLGRERNGARPLRHLSLGAFFRRASTLGAAAVRDLQGAQVLPATPGSAMGSAAADSGAQSSLRSWQGFLGWISDQADVASEVVASQPAPSHYLLAREATLLSAQQAPFTFLGGSAIRWFLFDEGGELSYRAHQSGLQGATLDVFESLRLAARSWTRDPDTLIQLRYAGTTNATSGLLSSDGVSAVLWDDPNNEIDGEFVCGQGGVLGLGGGFTLGSQSFPNGTARRLVEADVVINQGAGCFFDGAGGLDGQEILGHELGHTLGLGHTNVQPQQSLMRSNAHGDGRGARLGDDDRAGIFFLYAGSDPGSPGRIEVGTSTVLIGEAVGQLELQLVRRGGSSGAASVAYRYVDIEARAGIDYVSFSGVVQWADGEEGVREIPVAAIDDQLAEGDERFRLLIENPVGASLAADRTTVTIVDDEVVAAAGTFQFTTASTAITERSGLVNVSVSREGGSSGAASVGVRLRGGSARRNRDFAFVDTVVNWPAGDAAERVVEVEVFLDGEIELVETIVLELHSPSAGANLGQRDRHVLDLSEDVAPGPCVSGTQSLCLVNGRFRVDTQWSTATGAAGDGQAVVLTADTGYYWFFTEENVEATVKVLDACSFANRFWVFAGGLTDVEVRIRVVDTLRDAVKVYSSALGTPFQPIQDTDAFATCP